MKVACNLAYDCILFFLFAYLFLRELLISVVQEVQSALSSMDVLSEEPDGYAKGSTQSLVVPTNATSGPKRAETFSGFDSKLKPDNIYRASSMRVPERPGMSAGFPSRQLPATGATTGESPKLRHKRKTSGGSWPFLPKGNSKDDKEQSGERGTGKIPSVRGMSLKRIRSGVL